MELNQVFQEANEFFKYIDITPGSLKTITENSLIMAPPSRYYQPFDCNPWMMDFSLDKNNIQHFVNGLDGLSNYKKQKMVNNITNASGDIDYALKNEIMVELMEKWGMNCFSGICDSIPMWTLYANRHEGMCLKFDARFDTHLKAQQVNYVEKIHPLSPLDYDSNDIIKSLLLTKPSALSFEDEVRLIKPFKGPLRYDKKALTEIIFGLNTFETDIYRVVKLTRDYEFPNISFKRCKISSDYFKIFFEEFKV